MNNILTIAIPVYERFDFFQTALNSALNQTIPVPVLVIDNASSHDKIKEICFQHKDNVRYIKNEYNIGMWPNWNKCAQEAESEYIFILGDDDIMDSNYVETFLIKYKENPSVDIFYSDFKYLFETGNQSVSKSNWKYNNIWEYNKGSQIKKNGITKGLCLPTIACVIRRNLLLQMPFIAKPHASNDWFFYYHLPDETLFWGENQEMITYRKHAQADTASFLTMDNCTLSRQCMLYDILEYSDRENASRKKAEIYATLIRFYVLKNKLTKTFFSVDSPYLVIRNRMFNLADFIPIIEGCFLFLVWGIKRFFK